MHGYNEMHGADQLTKKKALVWFPNSGGSIVTRLMLWGLCQPQCFMAERLAEEA